MDWKVLTAKSNQDPAGESAHTWPPQTQPATVLTHDPHSQISRTPLATPVTPSTRPETRWKLPVHRAAGCAPSAHVGRRWRKGRAGVPARPAQAATSSALTSSARSQLRVLRLELQRRSRGGRCLPRCRRWGTCQVGACAVSPEAGFPDGGEQQPPAWPHSPGVSPPPTRALLFCFVSPAAQGF